MRDREERKKERKKEEESKKMNKIEIFMFGFLEPDKVSWTNRVDLALE